MWANQSVFRFFLSHLSAECNRCLFLPGPTKKEKKECIPLVLVIPILLVGGNQIGPGHTIGHPIQNQFSRSGKTHENFSPRWKQWNQNLLEVSRAPSLKRSGTRPSILIRAACMYETLARQAKAQWEWMAKTERSPLTGRYVNPTFTDTWVGEDWINYWNWSIPVIATHLGLRMGKNLCFHHSKNRSSYLT